MISSVDSRACILIIIIDLSASGSNDYPALV